MNLARLFSGLPGQDQRRGLRIPVEIEATVCSSAITRRRVTMTDLSLAGCRIESPFGWAVGSIVVITIPTLAPRAARIRWRNASSVGLSFERRLGVAVIDHVIALPKNGGAAPDPADHTPNIRERPTADLE